MNSTLLVLVLLVVLLGGSGVGWRYGGPLAGSGVGLVVLVLLVLVLLGRL